MLTEPTDAGKQMLLYLAESVAGQLFEHVKDARGFE